MLLIVSVANKYFKHEKISYYWIGNAVCKVIIILAVYNARRVVLSGSFTLLLDVQTMDAKLLQKIEELTLYVIDLKKEINQLKKKK